MKWLMKLLGVNPDMMKLAESGSPVTVEAKKALDMSDDEKLDTLRQFCHAYGTKDFSNFDPVTMDGVVRSIGDILNARGGIEEMRRFVDQLGSVAGIRSLELNWDGIGEWTASLPACDLGARTSVEETGDTLRAGINVDGQTVEAEFFDGVIWTGEENDDLTGNFDLSMRVSQSMPISTVLQQLSVKLPWRDKEASFATIASGPLADGLSVTLTVDEAAPWLEGRSQVPEWADVYWGEKLLGRVTIRAEA